MPKKKKRSGQTQRDKKLNGNVVKSNEIWYSMAQENTLEVERRKADEERRKADEEHEKNLRSNRVFLLEEHVSNHMAQIHQNENDRLEAIRMEMVSKFPCSDYDTIYTNVRRYRRIISNLQKTLDCHDHAWYVEVKKDKFFVRFNELRAINPQELTVLRLTILNSIRDDFDEEMRHFTSHHGYFYVIPGQADPERFPSPRSLPKSWNMTRRPFLFPMDDLGKLFGKGGIYLKLAQESAKVEGFTLQVKEWFDGSGDVCFCLRYDRGQISVTDMTTMANEIMKDYILERFHLTCDYQRYSYRENEDC